MGVISRTHIEILYNNITFDVLSSIEPKPCRDSLSEYYIYKISAVISYMQIFSLSFAVKAVIHEWFIAYSPIIPEYQKLG